MTRPRNLDLLLAATENAVPLVPRPDDDVRLVGERPQLAKVERLIRRRKRYLAMELAERGFTPEVAHPTLICCEIVRHLDRWETVCQLRHTVMMLFGAPRAPLPSRSPYGLLRKFRRETAPFYKGCLHNLLDHPFAFRPDRKGSRPTVLATHPYDPVDEGLDVALAAAGRRLLPTGGFPSWWFPGSTQLVVMELTPEAGELWRERQRLHREARREARRDRFLAVLYRP